MSSPSSVSSNEFDDSDLERQQSDYVESLHATPAHRAVLNNDVVSLQELISNRRSLINMTDRKGDSPLHWAIAKNRNTRRECFDLLVNHKDTTLESLDTSNYAAISPLFLAVDRDDPYYALTLIRKGANIHYVNGNSETPINVVINALVAKELILKGADVNHIDSRSYELNTHFHKNCTPIGTAVANRRLDVVHCLLFYGADVTIPNGHGILPFFYSPPEIEEMMFNLTFDELEHYEVNLSKFVELIDRESPFFYRILELCSDVKWDYFEWIWDDAFVWMWELFDNHNKLKMLKSLLNKFSDIALRVMRKYNPLELEPSNVIEIAYAFDETYASEVMFQNFKQSIYYLDYLLKPEGTKFIFYLLSKGLLLTRQDMDEIYKHFGFNELFRLLLHMKIVRGIDASGYGWHIYDPTYNVSNDSTHVKFFHHGPGVSSLLELSREVARRHLVSTFELIDNVKFFTFLNRLPILQIYKDILCYKREIYR